MVKAFFIHIQKTAGTSMRVFLERSFGKANCIWHAPWRIDDCHDNLFTIAENRPDRLVQAAVLGGHVGFGEVPKVVLDEHPVFLSILRDPVARIISYYQYLRASPDHGLNSEVSEKTLRESLDANRFRKRCEESQIEMLCGAKNLGALRRAMREQKFLIGKQEEISEYLNYCAEYFEVSFSKEARANEGAPGYIDEIASQPGYDEALEIIRGMNPLEYEFYNSFGAVWSNVET